MPFENSWASTFVRELYLKEPSFEESRLTCTPSLHISEHAPCHATHRQSSRQSAL